MPGVSWECATSVHGGCHEAGCRCMCHYRLGQQDDRSINRVQTPIEMLPTPPHDLPANGKLPTCPKCGTPAATLNDKFCRKDGVQLKPDTLHCGHCGVESPASDLYCASCGTPLTTEVSTISQQ